MEEHDTSIENELMEFAFGEVTDSSREIFSSLGREYSDGETLFCEYDSGRDLFVILSGSVIISKSDIAGHPLQLAKVFAGEIIGEMSHFDELPRSATAIAEGLTRALVFSPENFSLIFQLHPKWTISLVEGLCRRIRKSLEGLSL